MSKFYIMKKISLYRIVFIVFIIFSFFLSLWMFKAPKPQPTNLVFEKFSVDRAFKHIEQIAKLPHSVATIEHERVRNYIVDELEKLGLEVSIQSTTAMYDFRGSVSAGNVRNIIAVLKGRGEGKSILVSAHYDSQPNTLGASDDGVGVAAILESARALTVYPTLKNDVIFLISDAEEGGLFGAKAFADQHPLMQNVGLVLNLEARGTSGPSYTFEVSPENGWIMREYIKAARFPMASSLAYEVYSLMSNNSDFTIYKNLGYSGFNTAFIENYENYHSMTDNPEKIDMRSLQHHGSYIMDIVKHFGELDLSNTKADDLVYFNWFGYSMISYPQSWNWFLIIIVSLLFVVLILLGIQRKEIHIWKIVLGFLVFVVALGLSLGGVYLMQNGLRSFYPWYENFYDANFYNVTYYFFAFAAFCLLIISAVYALLYKKLGIINLWIGVLFFNLILTFIIQIYIPTGLFLTLVPSFLLQLAIILKFVFNFKLEQKRYLILIAILSFPVITLFMPFVKILYITFGLEMAIGGSFVCVLLLSYLLPVFEAVFSLKRWVLTLLASILMIGSLFMAHLKSDYNEDRPLQSHIMYCQNAESKESLWVTSVHYLDRWNKQFFTDATFESLTEIYPHASQIRIKSPAPYMEFPPAEMTVLSDTIIDSLRILRINICSNRRAENAHFFIHKNAGIEELKINGFVLENPDFYSTYYGGYHLMNYYGMYEEGINFEIICKMDSKFDLIMVEKKLGLPQFDEYEKMPNYIVPQAGYSSNMSIIRYDWDF